MWIVNVTLLQPETALQYLFTFEILESMLLDSCHLDHFDGEIHTYSRMQKLLALEKEISTKLVVYTPQQNAINY